jgi:hypothetical protein
MAHVESYLNASLGLARVGVRKMASCVAGTTTAVQACGRGPSSRSRWSSTMRDARGTTSIGGYPLIDASVSRGVIDTRTRRT